MGGAAATTSVVPTTTLGEDSLSVGLGGVWTELKGQAC